MTKLSEYSNEIQNLQNSWNHDYITKVWIDFYYFCLSNIYGQFVFDKVELQHSCPVLYDERNKLFYDATSIDNMKQLLLKPSEPLDLEFRTGANDTVRVSLNRDK